MEKLIKNNSPAQKLCLKYFLKYVKNDEKTLMCFPSFQSFKIANIEVVAGKKVINGNAKNNQIKFKRKKLEMVSMTS